MKKILGIIIIFAGCAIAHLMGYALIGDIIALGALILGGKLISMD